MLSVVFFFQAEDGIRDSSVTGVQTCALPISLRAIIEEALASADAKSWEQLLTAADVPCAAIWPISEIVHHPQLAHREVLQQSDSPHGRLTLVAPGFQPAHRPPPLARPPPTIRA